MSRPIYGIDHMHARTRAIWPSEVSLEPGLPWATSEVCVIDELTFFKGLSGDEASSIIIVGCLPRLLPHPSNSSYFLCKLVMPT